MKRCRILLILILFCSISSRAQSDFRPGYIINYQNDTTFGLISYKGNKANSKYCFFKPDQNSEPIKYSPSDIINYRFINGKYYITKKVNTGETEELIFLEYLVNGVVDMYYYRDFSGDHYFVDRGDGVLVPLKHEIKEVWRPLKIDPDQEILYAIDTKEYIGTLKNVFIESPSTAAKVENMELNHKSLIRITKDYHSAVCPDSACIVYEKKMPKSTVIFGAMAGVNFDLLHNGGDYEPELYYLQASDFNVSVYPTAGLFLKVNMPDLNERLFFQFELSFGKRSFSSVSSYTEPVQKFDYVNNISLSQFFATPSVWIRYEFLEKKVTPSFMVGCFMNYYFSNDYTRDLSVNYSWGGTYYTDSTNVYPFSDFDIGPALAVGIITKINHKRELNVDLKYQLGFNAIPHTPSSMVTLMASIQLGSNKK
jgi:hypothetical protein